MILKKCPVITQHRSLRPQDPRGRGSELLPRARNELMQDLAPLIGAGAKRRSPDAFKSDSFGTVESDCQEPGGSREK